MKMDLLSFVVSQDSLFVRKMAACPDGATGNGNGLNRLQYIVLHSPQPPDPVYSQDDIIRSHLGNHRCVLIKGQALDGPESFTGEEVERFKGSLAQPVEWQGEWHA